MKKAKNEVGIAHVMLVVLLVAVVAVAGLAGYEVYSKNNKNPKDSSTTTSTVAKASTNDTCLKQLQDKDLCKFATQYSKLSKTSYSMAMTTSDGQGNTTMSMKLSQDASGNTQGSFNMGSNSFLNADYIQYGQYIYSKDPSGNGWDRFKSGSADAPPTDTNDPLKGMDLFSGQDYNGSGNYSFKKLGQEACGSTTCFKYQVTDKTNPGSTNYLWFDVHDYQLRHMLIKDSQGSYDLTMTYENVKIVPPAQYTDVPTQ